MTRQTHTDGCDTFCFGDEEGHGHLTITRSHFDLFVARVKRHGERRYTVLGKTSSQRKAHRMLADAMTDSQWKRGDVLGTTRAPSYYDPSVLVEMKR